jgi:hypothetical protein
MKAWIVSDISERWVSLFHAETQGKAKLRALEEYNLDEFTDMRAIRMPKLDDKPFTYFNCLEAGFQYEDEGLYLTPDEFINDCPCEVCHGKKA